MPSIQTGQHENYHRHYTRMLKGVDTLIARNPLREEGVCTQVPVCVASRDFKAIDYAISSPRIVVRALAKLSVSMPRRCSIET